MCDSEAFIATLVPTQTTLACREISYLVGRTFTRVVVSATHMLRLVLLSFISTAHAQSTANAGLGGLLSAVVVNATLPTYSQCNTNLLSTANATGARTASQTH